MTESLSAPPVAPTRARIAGARRGVRALLAASGWIFAACRGQSNAARTVPDSTAATAAAAAAPSAAAAKGPSCPATGRWELCSVKARLEASGLAPRLEPDSVAHDFMEIGGAVFQVGDARLEVYIFPDEKRVKKLVNTIDTLNVARSGERGDWSSAPTFIHSANLAAILLSNNARQVERVQDALLAGPPMAAAR
jgi:hypothetical protein